MMMTTSTEKTSLEWFLRSPVASNMPQTQTTPAAVDLQIAVSRLIDAYFNVIPKVPATLQESWVASGRDALRFLEKIKHEFTMTEAFELVSVLTAIGQECESLKGGDTDAYGVMRTRFRAVLASLILFAKESRDASYKSAVLHLVKRWEISE
jgi:hypothetical protein